MACLQIFLSVNLKKNFYKINTKLWIEMYLQNITYICTMCELKQRGRGEKVPRRKRRDKISFLIPFRKIEDKEEFSRGKNMPRLSHIKSEISYILETVNFFRCFL